MRVTFRLVVLSLCAVCVVPAALLIASKYEEIYAPAVRDLVHVSAKAYTREEILRMETTILSTLKFQVRRCALEFAWRVCYSHRPCPG